MERPVRVLAAIEIIADSDGRLPTALLRGAYRASERGMIVLALRGVATEDVDSILDEVVPLLPHDIPGVLYVDADDEETLREAIRDAPRLFVSTYAFLSRLEAMGFDHHLISPVAMALEILDPTVAERPSTFPGKVPVRQPELAGAVALGGDGRG